MLDILIILKVPMITWVLFFNYNFNFDRYIFYKIKDHIINVFVNSVIYGIESQDERLLYEKNKKGQLALTFKQEFGEIVIEMLDDGQGIDDMEIFQRAEKAGMVDINKKYFYNIC